MRKAIPNILSFLRIPLSVVMLLFAGNPSILVALYCVCGITDILDGYFARRFNAESALGAKIDSLADMVFCGTVIIITLCTDAITIDTLFIAVIVSVAIVRVFNMILTKKKFLQWGVLHTWGNKTTGIMLLLTWPVCVLLGCIPVLCTVILGSVALLSSLEETMILFLQKAYNPNTRSFFHNAS